MSAIEEPTIYSLIPDIYRMLEGRNVENPKALSIAHHAYDIVQGKSGSESNLFKDIAVLLDKQVLGPPKSGATLRMSNLGSICSRRLWFDVNEPQPFVDSGRDVLRFLYGDLLEAILLAFAKASGHKVEAEQEKVGVLGVVGHIDCIIDGMLVDIKSASPFVFNKFKNNGLHKDDPFGYRSQLSSYLYALQDDPRLKYKDRAAFWAVDKATGEMSLDVYDLSDYLIGKETEIEARIEMVQKKEPPEKRMPDEPQSETSKNRKLGSTCRYCSHKAKCWPGLRIFEYSNGPVYLTHVEKEPRVPEVGAEPEVVSSNDGLPDF